MFNTDLLLLIRTELISVLPVQVVRNEERRLSDGGQAKLVDCLPGR